MKAEAKRTLLALGELERDGLSYCDRDDYTRIVGQLGISLAEAANIWAPKDFNYPWDRPSVLVETATGAKQIPREASFEDLKREPDWVAALLQHWDTLEAGG